jgi:hypothetical protein
MSCKLCHVPQLWDCGVRLQHRDSWPEEIIVQADGAREARDAMQARPGPLPSPPRVLLRGRGCPKGSTVSLLLPATHPGHAPESWLHFKLSHSRTPWNPHFLLEECFLVWSIKFFITTGLFNSSRVWQISLIIRSLFWKLVVSNFNQLFLILISYYISNN